MSALLKNSWLYKKRINIMLSTLGLGSTAYMYLRYEQEQRFNHPVVKEILRLMERNTQVIELVGYPLDTQIGVRSVFNVNNDIANLYFIVAGPKGKLTVEAHALSKQLSELNSITAAAAATTEEQPANVEGKKSPYTRFYVPDKSIYEQMKDAKGDEEKLKAIQISSDEKFWKLEAIFADLGGQYRIPVLENDEERVLREKTRKELGTSTTNTILKSNSAIYVQTLLTPRKTALDIWQEHAQRNFKDTIDGTTLSEAEQEERRRFRTNQMYQKIGYVRGWMFLGVILGGMGTYIYIMKNKRISILNSQIHKESMAFIKKSPVAKNLFGATIRFSTGVRGAQVDKEAEFDMDVIGEKFNGVARIKGSQKESGVWNIDTLVLEQKDQQGNILQSKKIV